MSAVLPASLAEPAKIHELPVDDTVVIEIGDLLYQDTDDAKPASSQADGGSEGANQLTFAENFLGVAVSAHDGDGAGVVRFVSDVELEFPCTSDTFEIGDMVGADEAASGTALEDRSVKKLSDKDAAIGVVTRRYASATTKVWCRLTSTLIGNLALRKRSANGLAEDQVLADDVDLTLGTGEDAQIRWSTGDASNHALVIAAGDSSQAVHITDKGAIATDWNISGTTDPNVYIHSNTTPATDYLRIGGHTGTAADIDVVGGTTLNFMIAGVASAAIIGAKLFMGDTADTDLTVGMCINQGAADDSIMTFKSSDVSHGMTDDFEADTYGAIMKFAAADGGLKAVGLSDASVAVEIFGAGATADSTDAPATTSTATITLNGAKKSTATFGALGATENLLNVENLGTAEFVVKGDGELYSNQSATVGTFDDHDDAIMAADLSYALSNEYAKIVSYNAEMFEQLGILGPVDDKGGRMYSLTKMTMLTLCACGQLGRQINALAQHLGIGVTPNGQLLPAPQ